MTNDEMKIARRKLRLNQQQLAALCGVTQGWISEIEHGKAAVPTYIVTILRLGASSPSGLDTCLEALNA